MNKKRFVLIISILLVVIVLGLATSYSLFTYNITKNTNFKLVIGTLELKIENTQTEDKIIMENVVPTKDSEGLNQEGYTFTIKNTGTMDSYYTVYLDDILLDGYGERLDNSYVKLNVLNHKNNQDKTTKLSSFESDRKLASGILEKGNSITYTVKMWVDYKAGNDAQNKYFSTQIRVVGEQVNAVGYKEDILNGTDPVLTDNLVPIKIDDKGTVTKANTNEKWYSYEDKNWANAVVLKTPVEVIGDDNIHGATIENGYATFTGKEDSYINLGLADYQFNKEHSIAVNFKLNVLNETVANTIIGNWESAGGGIYYNNGTLGASIFVEEYNTYIMVSTPFDDTSNYHTAVLTYDGNIVKLFLDGKIVDSEVAVGNYRTSIVPFFLAGNPGYSIWDDNTSNLFSMECSNVNIKEYAIFNRTLTPDEITTNMIDKIKITNQDGLLKYNNFSNTFENNEIIPELNIESYFVWIPKYSYQLWDLGNYNGLTTIDTTKPHAIPIKFGTINTDDSVTGECTTPGIAGESGNCKVRDYMTHPAFLAFDSTGFWVGKFETGYDGASSNSTAMVNTNDSSKVIVKPNVYSWRHNTVGNMFETSYNYIREDDSHMMKNTEWGAVAYLQHSDYGGQGSLRINNANNVTGYSAIEEPTLGYNSSSIEGNRYEDVQLGNDGAYSVNYFNILSNNASTTGNYTGIYDMSGCSWEYVMGYTTGATEIGGGSFITNLYSDFFTNKEWEKYYDKYTSISTLGFNNRILGDATGEMGPFYELVDPDNSKRQSTSWYVEYSQFFYSTLPWFRRGGFYANGVGAGIFAFYPNHGTVEMNHSFRIVLTPTK